ATAENTTIVDGNTLARYVFNITNLVSAWQDGTKQNFGVMLKRDSESGTDSDQSFSTSEGGTPSNTPNLTVTYNGGTACGVINGNYSMNSSVSSSGTCYIINASGLTFNCRGYSISGSAVGAGILVNGSANVNITNCNITGFEYQVLFTPRYSGVSVVGNPTFFVINGSFSNAGNEAVGTTGIYMNRTNSVSIYNASFTSSKFAILFNVSSDCQVKNVSATSNGPAIRAANSPRLFVDNSTLLASVGKGGALGLYAENTSDLKVNNTIIGGFTGCDFCIFSSEMVRIERSTTRTLVSSISPMYSRFYIQSTKNATLVNNTVLLDSTMDGSLKSGLGEFFLNNSPNATLWSNYVVGTADSGFNIFNCTNVSMFGAYVDGLTSKAGYVINFTNSSYFGNITAVNNSGYGIMVLSSYNNTIANASAINNSLSGIYVQNSDNNTFQNLTVGLNDRTQTGAPGIYLVTSNNNSISNATVYGHSLGSTTAGIGTSTAKYNRFYNSTIVNNSFGIYLVSSANDFNEFYNVTVSSTSSHGIWFRRSGSNLVMNSSVSSAISGSQVVVTNGVQNNTMANTTFDIYNTSIDALSFDNLMLDWYARAQVLDYAGAAISGAAVNITNSTFTQVNYTTTDATGYTDWARVREGFMTGSGLTSFNNFTFNVSKSGYTSNYTNGTINATTRSATVYLPSVPTTPYSPGFYFNETATWKSFLFTASTTFMEAVNFTFQPGAGNCFLVMATAEGNTTTSADVLVRLSFADISAGTLNPNTIDNGTAAWESNIVSRWEPFATHFVTCISDSNPYMAALSYKSEAGAVVSLRNARITVMNLTNNGNFIHVQNVSQKPAGSAFVYRNDLTYVLTVPAGGGNYTIIGTAMRNASNATQSGRAQMLIDNVVISNMSLVQQDPTSYRSFGSQNTSFLAAGTHTIILQFMGNGTVNHTYLTILNLSPMNYSWAGNRTDAIASSSTALVDRVNITLTPSSGAATTRYWVLGSESGFVSAATIVPSYALWHNSPNPLPGVSELSNETFDPANLSDMPNFLTQANVTWASGIANTSHLGFRASGATGYVRLSSLSMIWVEPPPVTAACGTPITQNSILTGDISSSGTCVIFGGTDLTLDCKGYSIYGDGTGYGAVSNYDRVKVHNCTFRTFATGIFLNNSLNNTLTNNTVFNSTYGIWLNSSNRTYLLNNSLFNITKPALSLNSTVLAQISNTLAWSNTSFGILLTDSNYTNMTNSTARSDAAAAVHAFSSQYLLMLNSTSGGTIFALAGLSLSSSTNTTVLNSTLLSLSSALIVRASTGTSIINSSIATGISHDAYGSGNTSIINTTFDRSSISWVDADASLPASNITAQWYLNFTVDDISSTPVAGISVNSTPVFGGTSLFNSTTNDAGDIFAQLFTEFTANGTFTYSLSSQQNYTTYSNWTFFGNKTGYHTNSTNATVDRSQTISLIMKSTTDCGSYISSSTTLEKSMTSGGTCLVINGSSITLDCAGYTITYGTALSNSWGILVNSSNNVMVKNCYFEKLNSSGTSAAVLVNRSNIVTLYNNTLYSLGSTSHGFWVRNLSTGLNITNNSFVIGGRGVYADSRSEDVLVERAIINTTGSTAAGVYAAAADNVTLRNSWANTTYSGVYATSSTLLTLGNNTLFVNGYPAVQITTDSYNFLIHNNTIDSGTTGANPYCISIDSSDYGTIANNTLFTRVSSGIDFTAANYTNITNNPIISTSASSPIYLQNSAFDIVDSNFINSTGVGGTVGGIALSGGLNITLSRNNITAGTNGIRFLSGVPLNITIEY
ncbi:MAG: right-handed parallel beta-helix repeat-containing protein, partial [Candidatus Micrarchaeia archaeon]